MRTRNLPVLYIVLSLAMSSCTTQRLGDVTTHQYVLNDSLEPVIDSSLYLAAEPYRTVLAERMSQVLCRSEAVMEKGQPEGALGNFVADVCLSQGNYRLLEMKEMPADCIILNNGGLRKPLPKGEITLGDIYEVMPFENRLEVLTCDGKLTEQLCEFIAAMGGTPVAGISFVIEKPSGKPKDILIGGMPLDTLKSYRIFTADYLANGGDRFELFKRSAARFNTQLLIRDALIDYTRAKGNKGESINARTDGRIRYGLE
jgi:2',3'-cyclic-nucleotide 2'-phosphodiesterase (5'-nucleotidase family)